MIKQIRRQKSKNTVFICQVTESCLKIVKCLAINSSKREFLDLDSEEIPSDIDHKSLILKIKHSLNRLGFGRNPLIISLARSNATLRFSKVPAQTAKEIEKIVALQAARYLPYPANELITGYQTISVDKEGYSQINLVIVHKDVIERYLKIFNELKVGKISIVLSSFGLCNLYNYAYPQAQGSVMLVDVDTTDVEVAIISNHTLPFSRSFKLNRQLANWQNLFIDEVNKSADAYSKEVGLELPNKTIVLGAKNTSQEFREILNKSAYTAESLSYEEKISFSATFLNKFSSSVYSLASLIGLGLKETEEPLNLLPEIRKEEIRKLSRYKERLKAGFLIAGILLIWFLAIYKNLDNKAKYIQRLRLELNKIAKEARPLEEIERQFALLESQAAKRTMILDVFYELHRILPSQVYLLSLNIEEDNQLTLRGQSQELSSLFILVSQLEKSPAFKKFSVKVKYATKKMTLAGEVVDFEIACTKK